MLFLSRGQHLATTCERFRNYCQATIGQLHSIRIVPIFFVAFTCRPGPHTRWAYTIMSISFLLRLRHNFLPIGQPIIVSVFFCCLFQCSQLHCLGWWPSSIRQGWTLLRKWTAPRQRVLWWCQRLHFSDVTLSTGFFFAPPHCVFYIFDLHTISWSCPP